ncbi:TadE/TadG family type IV pilus assembly protein [Massilia sp. H6]|uniref:TadE/TadG family type IV pilus assembly protein n=1 Tax=Massilia sp. H6 TaxID=2970464 RepID=UPI002166F9DB|nr:TadE family protein [Massilia sp. H6]UVW26846.1 pilus assembly protein [Massilia sp. H6]
MPANKRYGVPPGPTKRQSGVAAVEFALVAVLFFTFVFGIVEVARAMYVFNTLQEVTRRAARDAANTDFRDAAALALVRQRAVFRTAPGALLLADPVSDAYIRIDYLAIQRGLEGSQTMLPIADANLPASAAENRRLCLADPNDAQCIRLVRVRVCMPGEDGCARAQFRTMLAFVELPLSLHSATTIVAAESLGEIPGAP